MLEIELNQLCEITPGRVGEDNQYWLNSDKIKADVGWVKEVTLEKGIEALISWGNQYKEILKETNLLLVNGTNFYLIFTGNGSTLKDFKKIAEGKLSNKIIDLETEESSEIDIEFLSCYGAVKIMTEGFASEAIAVTDSNKAGKKLFFTRIFDIFS